MKLTDINKKLKKIPTVTFKSTKDVIKRFPFLDYELNLKGITTMYDAIDAFSSAVRSNKVFQITSTFNNLNLNSLKEFLYRGITSKTVDSELVSYLDIDKLLDKVIVDHKVIIYDFKIDSNDDEYFIVYTDDFIIDKKDVSKINMGFDLLLKNSPSGKDKLAEIKEHLKRKYNIGNVSSKLSKLESVVINYPELSKEIELLTKLTYLLSL